MFDGHLNGVSGHGGSWEFRSMSSIWELESQENNFAIFLYIYEAR